MIKTSLAAIGVTAITVISLVCNGGPTGDRNKRPPTPSPSCHRDAAGNLDCPLQTGVQGVKGLVR